MLFLGVWGLPPTLMPVNGCERKSGERWIVANFNKPKKFEMLRYINNLDAFFWTGFTDHPSPQGLIIPNEKGT